MVNVTKMYHTPDCESFDAFGRVLSGTLKVGMDCKVRMEACTRSHTLPLLWPLPCLCLCLCICLLCLYVALTMARTLALALALAPALAPAPA